MDERQETLSQPMLPGQTVSAHHQAGTMPMT
jgi:hypothetical protein